MAGQLAGSTSDCPVVSSSQPVVDEWKWDTDSTSGGSNLNCEMCDQLIRNFLKAGSLNFFNGRATELILCSSARLHGGVYFPRICDFWICGFSFPSTVIGCPDVTRPMISKRQTEEDSKKKVFSYKMLWNK
ncbi:hypothetical protein ScPMuIL_014275 [Solemya velum]